MSRVVRVLTARSDSTQLVESSWELSRVGQCERGFTWIEREFNACQTPRSMYPYIFNRFPVIQAWSLKVRHFSTCLHILASPPVRPWDNRGKCYMDRKRIQWWSNASQPVPSIFNHFWDIAIYRWRVTGFWQFSWANERFLPYFAFSWVHPWDNRGKCHTVGKRIQRL